MKSLERASEILLRKMIREIVLERKKPGGGITKIGAKKIIDPSGAEVEIRNALSSEEGSVSDAADKIGVSARTLYSYIEDDARLEKIKDKFQGDKEQD